MSGDSGLRSILPQLATGTKEEKTGFGGVNSDAMYMAIFWVERILQTMSKSPSIFAIILVLLLHHIQESKAQCLKISQNLSFLRFSIFILQIFEL